MGDDHHSYYLPHATSLRMGDLGYTSNAQAGMDVCYNDLNQYISTLRSAILTPHPPYQSFKEMDNGERAQLNDSLLQIENEFYSPIRPKRVTRSGEAPIVALARGGIEYVEVRCVDINPFTPCGIDADTMRLLDLFLIACLIDASPLCDEAGQRRNKENIQRVVGHGRDPSLTLLSMAGQETPLAELANPLLGRMGEVASWFDDALSQGTYAQVVDEARARVADPSKTLSARMLEEMHSSGLSFWQLANRYSRLWHQEHVATPIEPSVLAEMDAEAAASLVRQQDLEAHQNQTFIAYLADFYAQYSS
jgi:glutamate--cysteine ligase